MSDIILKGESINGKNVIIAEPMLRNSLTPNTCTWYNCTRIIDRDKYCFHHKQYSGIAAPKKEGAAIAKVSEKRKKDKKEYLKIVAEMLAVNPLCEIKERGCQILATGLHHQKKRSPATYLNKEFLIRACNKCNLWVEINPLKAITKGHSFSKF